MKVKDIIQLLEEIAPRGFQETYDNSGLNLGNPENEVSGILCTLDVTEEVIDEALQKQANLILAHHPVLFEGLKSITGKNYIERIAIKAIRNNIAIYAGHTNFDNVPTGVNAKICEKLNLKGTKILAPLKEQLFKLVTFVPEEKATEVREAIFEAGGGYIGNYDKCSFNTQGQGTFRGLDHSDPYVGEKGVIHYESETKVEVILPRFRKNQVIQALLKSHPYEEVAYDIYPLANENPHAGAGMIGNLEKAMPLKDLLADLKKVFNATGIRYTGTADKMIKKVAVCGGSGSFLIKHALATGADVFITGDVKYHQFFDGGNRLSIVDIGHYESEQFTKDIFYESVMKKIPKFAVHLSEVKTSPINYFK
jgi:dinuclear metal center YbgI/SA1388 family protein